MPTNQPYDMALADLARSGLTRRDFKALRLEALSSDQTYELTGRYKSCAFRIPYFTAAGRPIPEADRLRFLQDVRGFGARKPVKYWQRPDTPPRAYFPVTRDWAAELVGATEVWVTEGEKKAAAACKAGLSCIGLGGVWSWRSQKRRQPFIPDLAEVDWTHHAVRICFDTDADPNPLVRGAEEALAHQFMRLGARDVGIVHLPLLGDADKTGLDDFLVARGAAALRALRPDLPAAGELLLRLNEELAVIGSPAAVLHVPTEQLFSKPQPLAQLLYANQEVDALDSAGRLVKRGAVGEWLRWPARRGYAGVAFEPGQPRVLDDGRYNLWRGWPHEPRRGDVSPFARLVDYLFSAAPAAHRRWFLQWLAYPVQRPGAKLYAACLLWSRETGTGKSLLGYTVGKVYGPAFAVVTEAELHGSFNSWQVNRQFVLGEEITGSDRRVEANRLKHLVTGETVRVNRKFQAEYDVRNCANFLFTSNHPDAFALEDEDRRYFVHDVGSGAAARPPASWFTGAYDAWLRDDAASGPALMHHLLGVDLAGFDPRGRAPETSDRADMIAVSGTDADRLARALRDSPDAVLRVGDAPVARDLFTLEELVALLDPGGRQRLGPMALARALRRAGLRATDMTRTARGRCRLWAVRGAARWLAAGHAERAAHYDGSGAGPEKSKF